MPKRKPRGYHPIILIMPHSTLCAAVADQRPAWGVGDVIRGWEPGAPRWDLSGRRNARAAHTWLVLPCKAPGCGARLAIYWPRVAEALGVESAIWVGGRQE